MAYIYKITNDINGKIYIGKTELSIEKRFKQHCNDSKKNGKNHRPLYAAMNKYGTEHFHIEVIEETNQPEEREQYWIETLQSFKYGYNATQGGDGKHYLDYDLIIKTYKEVKNCVKVAQLLNIHPESVRKILHNNHIPILSSVEIAKQIFRKPVAQIDLSTNKIIKIFNSTSEAEKATGIHGHIGQVCLGKRKSCGGYGWKYL